MTLQQRITGCLVCLLVGFLISMGSTFRLIRLVEGDPMPFATMYTIGNVLGLCSTCFLYGPVSQIKQMFAPTRYCVSLNAPLTALYLYGCYSTVSFMCRLVATGIYLFFMGLTMFLAFYPREIPVRVMWLVFAIFGQFLALTWYTLSYIPFARQIMINICQQTCCKGACPTQVRVIQWYC